MARPRNDGPTRTPDEIALERVFVALRKALKANPSWKYATADAPLGVRVTLYREELDETLDA